MVVPWLGLVEPLEDLGNYLLLSSLLATAESLDDA